MTLRLPSTSLSTRLLAPASQCSSYHSFLCTRLFSTISPRSDRHHNHYEVLRLPPDCSKAELKKQFYVLSKETHPDINPSDPHASRRFSQISESYSVLADPEKRRKYDREHVYAKQQRAASNTPGHRGSFAGSRPASGLSKRRSAFRGPPPSYYAHGNPSTNTAKTASASQKSSESSTNDAGTFNASGYAPDATYDPDFDPSRILRTQTHEDTRRQSRRAAEMARAQAEMEDDGNFWARFAVVSGVVILGVTVASIVGGMGKVKGGMVRGDGSRRSEGKNEWAKG